MEQSLPQQTTTPSRSSADAQPLGEYIPRPRNLRIETPEEQAERDRLSKLHDHRQKQLRAAALRDACGVWPRYRDAELEDVELPFDKLSSEDFLLYTGTRNRLEQLLIDPGIIVLAGGNGPGKTHLASALIHAFCDGEASDRPRAARYVTANDFFLEFKSTFGTEGRTQIDMVRRFRSYKLLVIDEIEVRSDSVWENNQLRDLINARYSLLVSTVICTNKTPDQLNGVDGQAYFGTALRDRIRESGGIIHCSWPSLRSGE